MDRGVLLCKNNLISSAYARHQSGETPTASVMLISQSVCPVQGQSRAVLNRQQKLELILPKEQHFEL